MTDINITSFKPLGEVETFERLRQFVDHYQPFASLLPCVTSFDENAWDLRGKYFLAATGNRKLRIRFVKLDVENQQRAIEPFDPPFREFAKAYTLHLMATHSNWKSPGNLKNCWVPALRHVEHGLRTALPGGPPCITSLTGDICEAVNATIRNTGPSVNKAYQICQVLNELARDLQDLGLCTEKFTWTGMIVPIQPLIRMIGPEGDKYREAMLPSMEAMAAMAYCFAHAESLREKWVSAINGLLAGHPARLGECWFLRENYWVETDVQGQKRFALKWWPQKKAKPLVKEFLADDPFVPVFRQCFEWLIEISAPARAIAKWYEKNPDKLYLPKEMEHLRSKEVLTVAEAASLRGVSVEKFWHSRSWAKNKGINPVLDPATEKEGINFQDLECAILSDLPYGFPWFNKAKNIKYSDMLVLMRLGEFHSRNPTAPTMFFLPNESTYYRVLDAMVDRHGVIEQDGTPVRVRSHQFRHQNETVAYKAGVARSWANRHAGRVRISQEESYDDRTDAEKVAQSSRVSVHRSVFGELVALEPNEPKTEAEIMAEVEVAKRTGYAHVTDKGCCTHNFMDKPCSNLRDCLFCEDHKCVKGVPLWDRNILAECAVEEENFVNALEAERRGMYGVKEHIEEMILPRVTYCRQVKALLHDPGVNPGTEFRHAPKGDPYDPVVNALRHHAELGRKNGLDVAWVESALERLQSIQSARRDRPILSDGGAP
jgi:hypothetical protein